MGDRGRAPDTPDLIELEIEIIQPGEPDGDEEPTASDEVLEDILRRMLAGEFWIIPERKPT